MRLSIALRSTRPRRTGSWPRIDVLRDGALGQQVELLVDDADAGPLGVARAAERPRLRRRTRRVPSSGRVHAGDDLHQGGLAGAVLTDDGVHLARPHVEVDAVEDAYAEERLADAPEREQRRRRSDRTSRGPYGRQPSRSKADAIESVLLRGCRECKCIRHAPAIPPTPRPMSRIYCAEMCYRIDPARVVLTSCDIRPHADPADHGTRWHLR